MEKCDNCPRTNEVGSSCPQLQITTITRDQVECALLKSIECLLHEDWDFLVRGVHERTITRYIFHYLKNQNNTIFVGLDIDPEYNRNGKDSKYYYGSDEKEHRAIPDLIIHKRNCNKFNLLYVEFKISAFSQIDEEKVRHFVADTVVNVEDARHGVKPYRFKYGACINLSTQNVVIRWIDNKGIDEKKYRIQGKKLINSDL